MTPTISQSLNILIVDDEINSWKTLPVCPEPEDHRMIAVSNSQSGLAEALVRFFELAFADLRLGKVFKIQTLEERVA